MEILTNQVLTPFLGQQMFFEDSTVFKAVVSPELIETAQKINTGIELIVYLLVIIVLLLLALLFILESK